MSRLRLLALFALSTALVLAALPPLRLVLGFAGDGFPLVARDVSGSVWNGHLRGTQWDLHGASVPLDDIGLRLKLLPLLAGQQQWVLDGERLQATLVRGRAFGLRDASGTLDLGDLAWPGSDLRLGLGHATVLFRAGRCDSAAGTLSLELLPPAASDGGTAQPLRLDGRLACDGRDGIAELAPAGSLPPGVNAATARLRLEPTGLLEAETELRTDEPALRLVLQAAGFADNGRGLQRIDSGRLAQ